MDLKKLRQEKGKTQEEVAQQVGVSRIAVRNWENGAPPKAKYLPKLAQALGCTVNDLLRPYM